MPDTIRFFLPKKLEAKLLTGFDYGHLETFKQYVACLYTFIYLYIYIFMYLCIYVFMCLCVYISVDISVLCVNGYLLVFMDVCGGTRMR